MGIHPEYRKARRRAITVGWGFVCIGLLGIVMPLLPGIILILVGFSLLSLHSKRAHLFIATVRARHPEAGVHLERIETHVAQWLNIATHTHEYIHVPRKGTGVVHVLLEVCKHQEGIVVLLHSAQTTREGVVQNSIAEAFRARGFTVVRFDAYNGIGEGDGTYTNLTATSYKEDLESVLAWMREQVWYKPHITLVGHSVGGLVAGLYAQEHPQQVNELFLLAPTISGAQYRAAARAADEEAFLAWEETRLKLVQHPLTGEDYGLAFGFVTDLDSHDLLPHANSITCTTHVLVGNEDTTSPPDTCETLVREIGGHAELHVLQGVPHIPHTHEHIRELERVLEAIE